MLVTSMLDCLFRMIKVLFSQEIGEYRIFRRLESTGILLSVFFTRTFALLNHEVACKRNFF